MIRFTIPGNPFGKQRPKFGNGRAYTPKATIEYEKQVALECMKAMKLADALMYEKDVPLSLEIIAYYPIAESWTKKKKHQAIAGLLAPTTKPDGDNVLKVIMDGMEGVAMEDDKQIVRARIQKIYSQLPRVDVELKEL